MLSYEKGFDGFEDANIYSENAVLQNFPVTFPGKRVYPEALDVLSGRYGQTNWNVYTY